MSLHLNIPSPIQKVSNSLWEDLNIEIWIKRDDLIHEWISGNKWRKLKHYYSRHKHQNRNAILSFGGAYSNHLSALAALCKTDNVKSIGVVRGDELHDDSNATIRQLVNDGMELIFVSRETYKRRYEPAYWQELRDQFGSITIIPEGGLGFDGMMGVSELVDEVEKTVDYWMIPLGTGTTLAGVLWQSNTSIIGFSSWSSCKEQKLNVEKLLSWGGLLEEDIEAKMKQVEWVSNSEFGRFGKLTSEAKTKIKHWSDQLGIPFDGVYNGKMWLQLIAMIENKYFPESSKIMFLHTGGLQGNKGLEM